jgi:SAM-dependent methyltransferase
MSGREMKSSRPAARITAVSSRHLAERALMIAIGGRARQAVCGWLFAAAYDWLLRGSERAGMADRRRDLLTQAWGATMEIGAGTGLNAAYYPATVTELVLTEPSPYMARRLRARAAQQKQSTRVVEAVGEQLPFPDASFDTVVTTLVLCTVVDLAQTLSEIARILRPHGRLLFLEQVRSGDPRLAAKQDHWHRLWLLLGHGCHCNRDTECAIATGHFTIERIAYGQMPKAPKVVQPLIAGVARRRPGTGTDQPAPSGAEYSPF